MSIREHGIEGLRQACERIAPGETRLRTTATGTFSISGLFTDLIITTLDVSDTATKIPSTPLTARNHIEIHNCSDVETLYVGIDSSVTADRVTGTTSGKEIPPSSYWNIDITDAIEIWGIAESGKTITVKITEVA